MLIIATAPVLGTMLTIRIESVSASVRPGAESTPSSWKVRRP